MPRHLLIDLESVQPAPAELASFMGEDDEAWVFYGPHQHKLKARFETQCPRSTLIPISRTGKNALDFHLVFYLGYLASRHPRSRFVILAKDTGYDAAVEHAASLKFSVERRESLVAGTGVASLAPAGVPPAAVAAAADPTTRRRKARASATGHKPSPSRPSGSREQPATPASAVPAARKPAKTRPLIAVYSSILKDLKAANRPRSMDALRHHIQTKFGPVEVPEQVDRIVSRLETMDVISLRSDALVYRAAAKPPAPAGP